MSGSTVAELCQRVRPGLACLAELGQPLLDVVTVVERVAGTAGVEASAEPAFDARLDVTMELPERLGLRRIELCRLRISEVDIVKRTVDVWGKGEGHRIRRRRRMR